MGNKSSNPIKSITNTVDKIGRTIGKGASDAADALTPGKDILQPVNKVVDPAVNYGKYLTTTKGLEGLALAPLTAGVSLFPKAVDKINQFGTDLADSMKPKVPDYTQAPPEFATGTPGATETTSLAKALRKRLASMRYGIGSTLLTNPLLNSAQQGGTNTLMPNTQGKTKLGS